MLRSIHTAGNVARRAFRPIHGTRLMSAYVDPLSGQPADLPDIQVRDCSIFCLCSGERYAGRPNIPWAPNATMLAIGLRILG